MTGKAIVHAPVVNLPGGSADGMRKLLPNVLSEKFVFRIDQLLGVGVQVSKAPSTIEQDDGIRRDFKHLGEAPGGLLFAQLGSLAL
jgi:hypothetical protein